ncbi:winged helix-turn-helix domain-containing protein [Clostridium sp.]|uniref:winged helix-turn-helix domain-containing protein n=1 Tax=Clostridium sp. TaxID=1506 RepID=UPI003464DF3F
MFDVKYKIWLDKDGKVFGEGPYKLLMGVKEKGSLSEAAKIYGISYNKAHTLIKNIEKNLGFPLIIRKTGGAHGGGSELTKEAEKLMDRYSKFYCSCEKAIEEIFNSYFHDFK